MRRRMSSAVAAVATLLLAAAPAAADCRDAHRGHGEQGRALAQVRQATAAFHSIGRTEAAGYQLGYIAPFLLDGCIAHPTDGAMGYHWFNHDRIHDTELDPRHPEGIVYAPTQNGGKRLAAVEWIVPADRWEAAGHTEPPELFGQQLHILNPALGWYILHAWVWMPNPSGVFSDWNPRVVCD